MSDKSIVMDESLRVVQHTLQTMQRGISLGDGMNRTMSRRRFVSSAAMAAAALPVERAFAKGPKARNIQVGHTGITWRNDDVEQAIGSISSLGFYGFETFGDVLE